MYIVALGECVIAAGIPILGDLPVGRTIGDRYGVMFSITIMSFFLCVQNFVASDTAKLEHNGGIHALHVSRFSRCVWLSCQFLAVSSMVIAGAICKNISKKLELSQFFRYWFGISIAIIIIGQQNTGCLKREKKKLTFFFLLASAIAQLLHVYPPGDVRTCSRSVRFAVRCGCGLIVFGLAWIPVSAFGEPGWIGVIAAVVSLFTVIEWVGRNRVGERKAHGHGHGGGHGHGHDEEHHHDDSHHDDSHDKHHHGEDSHAVPLLGSVITDESLKGDKKKKAHH